MDQMKRKMKELYVVYGPKLGKMMLISCLISAGILFLPVITMDSKISVGGIFEIIVAIPLFSIIVFATYLLSGLVRKLAPQMGKGGLVFWRIAIFFILVVGFGYLMSDVEITLDSFWQIAISVVFDLIYLGAAVLLALARRIKWKGEVE